MGNQKKSGGGTKKIGRNKGECERYSREHRRDSNKLKNFIKHNIPKGATEEERNTLIAKFKNKEKT
jgi:hypothetical protein